MPSNCLPPELLSPEFRLFQGVELACDERATYTDLRHGFNIILKRLKITEYVMAMVEDQVVTVSTPTNGHSCGTLLALYSAKDVPRVAQAYIFSPLSAAGTECSTGEGILRIYLITTVLADTELLTAHAQAHDPGCLETSPSLNAWTWAKLLVDVKTRSSLAPSTFHHTPSTYTDPTDGNQFWARLSAHATEMCFRQHRTSVPMISICHDYARFLRFDPAGVVMSEAFDYVEDPEPLVTFLFHYVHASRRARGFDPTATLASPDEQEVFRALAHNDSLRGHVKAALKVADTPHWPLHKLSCRAPWSLEGEAPMCAESPSSTREFLVGRPCYRSDSMIGTATRAFMAYDIARHTVVFIKGCWRPDLGPNHLSEYEVYLKLLSGSPIHIPTLLGGGDVLDEAKRPQRTLITESRWEDTSSGRIHARLVFRDVCRPLESFRDTRELVSIVYDALQAHKVAWERHGVLHCDISVGNILILDVPNIDSAAHGLDTKVVGLLCDWDGARTRAEVVHPEASESQLTRLGTWQFVSGGLLWYRRKPYLLSDDLESVYHVLNWCALKYLPHELTDAPDHLRRAMQDFYDTDFGGKGSFEKFKRIKGGHPSIMRVFRLDEWRRTPSKGDLKEVMGGRPAKEQRAGSGGGVTDVGAVDQYDTLLSDGQLPHEKPQSLLDHTDILGAFSEMLDRTTEWGGIEKLSDQVPPQSLCSSWTRVRA
ncbi:uncharacterized protein TRAVEDRAFT_52329 [Trametes versicolor FP-101664 SS1]|uniref:uncharacterized protein n=1 Tax=Trametes versicolor (strain FP-101664) TaxID=717944 RepID=UPI0004621FE4|nr:uncharacterized protein TRAVEDRAFT_52329 [Trametes versicolor FP-101664 SS1]EIW53195.1 hypothetical protein TRAVEDRAFT_52329 [Trametes versicolor FP-101664 SS1]